MALQVPEYAHVKACSVPMKKKLHSALLHSRQTWYFPWYSDKALL